MLTFHVQHFFQQGYTYYKIYRRALTGGATTEKATEKAINWGRASERTFYGTLVSGVYSNADLCANFAGMKFYLNLTQDVKIGNDVKPAILLLENGIWKFNEPTSHNNFIKPFISNHLNEALNPSIFTPGLRSFVRRTVRKQSCQQWRKQFPNQTPADFNETTNRLKLWNGENYGFKESDKFITIANTCFSGTNAK